MAINMFEGARRVAKWIGVFVAILAVVSACIYAVNAYKNQPQKVTTFLAISLGATMDEVAYSLGVPPAVTIPGNVTWDDGTVSKDARFVSKDEIVKNKTTYKDYFAWMYESDYFRTDVAFDPTTKTVIEIGCYASEKQLPVAYCTVNGIGPGTSEDRVIDLLGSPSSSSIDGVTKRLEYDNWNMTIYLVKRVAYYIKIREMRKP